MRSGFTLLETIIAVGIIVTALVGILGLLAGSVSVGEDIRNRHIAANLAQEGVEIVHNIRSTNWAEGAVWNDGLGAGTYCVQYDSAAPIAPCADPTLLLDGTAGVYTYDAGSATVFDRTITLTDDSDAEGNAFLRVISTVLWEGKTISAEDHLYDWK